MSLAFKTLFRFLLAVLFISCWAGAQTQSANYDESKVGIYILPDPLVFNNGKPVRSARDWKRRRAEILDLFATNVYGHSPKAPKRIESRWRVQPVLRDRR
jgi:hypothetical protein